MRGRIRPSPASAAIVALILIAAGGGCSEEGQDAEPEPEPRRELGLETADTLVVGSDIPYPPFAEGDPPDYEGFDIDVIEAVAGKLGLETRIKDTTLDVILGGTDQFDLSISAVEITPAREKHVEFSHPYFVSALGVLVREDSEIRTLEDIARNAVVGVEAGTDGATFASRGLRASTVRAFPSADDASNALFNERVDAVIADGPTVVNATETRQGLEVVDVVAADEEYGIVLPEKNKALLRAVNAALDEIKADGTLGELYEDYFEIEPPEELISAPGSAG